MEKPKIRSRIRQWLGGWYHRLNKYIYWNFGHVVFAEKQIQDRLSNCIFEHRTPLLRQLADTDMKLQHNKIHNLGIAIKSLNQLVVEPGQTLSYWRQIGEPTAAKGYLPGMVLQAGRVTAGVGGGLCQLSNLLFWLTIHTPLTITERWRHDYDVFPDCGRTQPFGSGATCDYPNVDLQITNNTGGRWQLVLKITDDHLVGEWRSDQPVGYRYRIVEKNHEIKSEFWGGYSRNNEIFRQVIDPTTGSVIKEEYITENHAVMMYNPLLGDRL